MFKVKNWKKKKTEQCLTLKCWLGIALKCSSSIFTLKTDEMNCH